MTILHLLAPAIAFLLLAAHFFRSGGFPAAVVPVLLIVLLLVRRPWAARVVQAALLVGALEWLRAMVTLVHARSELGEPFLRLALILGAVALFTALCALIVQTRRLRAHFRLRPGTGSKDPAHGS